MLRFVFATFALVGLAAASPPWGPAPGHWTGWSSITHIISFGDSYTETQFDPKGAQPSGSNPLGNPAYPGVTSSNGPNWIDLLTGTWNKTFISTVNLAYGGATLDGSLIQGWMPTVMSVKRQIEEQYVPIYADRPGFFDWRPRSTLFTIFIGINDINNAYQWTNKSEVYPRVMAEYAELVEKLYDTGARNFLFLNVPPIDRSPITVETGPAAVESQRLDIAAWNEEVSRIANDLGRQHLDATAFVFDTNALYNEVIDDPCSHPETCKYKETAKYCPSYSFGTPTWYTKHDDCSYAVDEYFWLNTLHPTFRIHNATAREITRQLGGDRYSSW